MRRISAVREHLVGVVTVLAIGVPLLGAIAVGIIVLFFPGEPESLEARHERVRVATEEACRMIANPVSVTDPEWEDYRSRLRSLASKVNDIDDEDHLAITAYIRWETKYVPAGMEDVLIDGSLRGQDRWYRSRSDEACRRLTS